MTATVQTYLGKVIFDSDKLEGEGDISEIVNKKEREKTISKFFPLGEKELKPIVFEPKEKFDTQEHRDALLRYLKEEMFIRPDGNFPIEVSLPLVVA